VTGFNVIDAMTDENLFGPYFCGPSWNAWRVVLRAAFALPMSAEEVTLFRSIAERDPPSAPVRELWIIGGRRAGKDSIASLLIAHLGALFDGTGLLRPGERASAMCIATDRAQSKIVLNYARELFRNVDFLRGMVTRETAFGFELSNAVDVEVVTNDYRATRGKPVLLAILDECSFWRSEDSATPDMATYQSIKPGTLTIPGSLIVGISTPYMRSGLLWNKFKRHYGKDGDVLVVRAGTTTLNPTIDQQLIDDALEDDPAAARTEFLAEWRDDIAAFVTAESVDQCVSPGVLERPRRM